MLFVLDGKTKLLCHFLLGDESREERGWICSSKYATLYESFSYKSFLIYVIIFIVV